MTPDHPEGIHRDSPPSRTNPFRKKRSFAPIAPEDMQRQGAISGLAFQLLGWRDPALDFLNSENAALGGRPIAIATQSIAGYAAVEREIRARSRRRGTRP